MKTMTNKELTEQIYFLTKSLAKVILVVNNIDNELDKLKGGK